MLDGALKWLTIQRGNVRLAPKTSDRRGAELLQAQEVLGEWNEHLRIRVLISEALRLDAYEVLCKLTPRDVGANQALDAGYVTGELLGAIVSSYRIPVPAKKVGNPGVRVGYFLAH